MHWRFLSKSFLVFLPSQTCVNPTLALVTEFNEYFVFLRNFQDLALIYQESNLILRRYKLSVPATCKKQVLTTDRRWYLVFFLKAKIFFQKRFSATVSLLKETLTNRKFQKL